MPKLRSESGARRPQINHTVVDMSTTLTASNSAAPSDRLKINGELVILGADGRLSFDALQQRLVTSPAKARAKAAQLPAAYAAFDLLAIGGAGTGSRCPRCLGTSAGA